MHTSPPLHEPLAEGALPDISAAWDGCSHGRHLLPDSNTAGELSQGNGSCGIPDEQEICGRGGVGEPRGAVHAGLNGQLVRAGVQLTNEGGVILGL